MKFLAARAATYSPLAGALATTKNFAAMMYGRTVASETWTVTANFGAEH